MEQPTVGKIVAEDYRAASVFEKHSIDFCCHGNVPLEEACRNSGVSFDEIRQELVALSTVKNGTEMYDTWKLDVLSDYIVQTHHRYVREALPVITTHLTKVANKHGEHHPDVKRIQVWFKEVAEELTRHIAKEEMVLFPYIKIMAKNSLNGIPLQRPQFGTITNPINMMEAEHSAVGNTLESIRSSSNDFTLPGDAYATFNVTYQELQQFETDLHKHIHLENNILFPKAVQMEQQLLGT